MQGGNVEGIVEGGKGMLGVEWEEEKEIDYREGRCKDMIERNKRR